MFLFRGGGWAVHNSQDEVLDDTIERIGRSNLGSSQGMDGEITRGGIMSGDKYVNPHFYDYTKIYLFYCDSAGH